ncbi:SpoIIIAH-like family protein [Paenibacillus filicis]|uniref:SpoIIIAH-like family protein n=1 Tax=Paenibacillus gyeongsangnamensis TaxID=3388067 RepID=A0ABT4Q7L1_9BACL|nr:SpoIIIAH-like family protein [Paenibacillus filicis]MCZ8512821.1 SpoIIIAH-like family protein [Paenibacillus filicis]
MNTKRQTIWLVSMLSLMVVLSAYYLFTEDVNKLDLNTKGPTPKEVTITAGELDSHMNTTNPSGAAAKPDANSGAQSDPKADQNAKATPAPAADGKTAPSPAAPAPGTTGAAKADPKADSKTDPKADSKGDPKANNSKTDTPSSAKPGASSDASAQPVSKSNDAKVLEKMQSKATSGSDYFINLQLKRDEDISKQVEKFVALIADTSQTKEAAAKAEADLRKLQDMETKISNLEDSLIKDYGQAVVTQDANKYKVTVQSKKLEKSQALSIADLTMKELGIGPESLSIQYLP